MTVFDLRSSQPCPRRKRTPFSEEGRALEFYEIDGYASAIERFKDESIGDGTSEEIRSVLTLALRVAKGEEGLAAAREQARRGFDLSSKDIDRLADIARQAGEENHLERHVLLELAQAAGVAALGLDGRNRMAVRLAAVAALAGHIERARVAFADAVEGLEIATRFFGADDDWAARAETRLELEWETAKSSTTSTLEIFDVGSGDPAAEWVDLIVWNSDHGSGNGLLAQVDATQRLAFRFEHWIIFGDRRLAAVAEDMRARCIAAAPGDPYLAARYLVTLGDALVEVAEWAAAAQVLHDVRRGDVGQNHPIGVHSLIQEAYCYLRLGDLDRCRVILDSVDLRQLESLAGLVITVAAELVRYHFVDHLYRHLKGDPIDHETGPRIERLMRDVAPIVSTSGEDSRTIYLRNLFFAVLWRDAESLLPAGGGL